VLKKRFNGKKRLIYKRKKKRPYLKKIVQVKGRGDTENEKKLTAKNARGVVSLFLSQ
jgi:hypothetical protein